MRKRFLERCWERMYCGMEQRCPAYPDNGEECWKVAGTMCASTAEETLKKFNKALREKGEDQNGEQSLAYEPMQTKEICRFVERYGRCKCCPFYQYIEKEKKWGKKSE